MTQSDVYYRALLAYRQQVSTNRACVRDNQIYAAAEGHGRITVTRALCTVDEAWIVAIEEGLVHIEKAIKEERQFIYSNGEVVPIEKVKNVSKDSIQHLARHAELITRVPEEGSDLVPDSLYTVERLSDYAVYENRFLYMLLCYLRDFVTLRYQNILELTNRYDGQMSIGHEIKVLNRTVNLSIDLKEERRDDPYLREHNPAKDLIDRINLILKTILSFLATPLMESASKAPMLKPPITKTNVLKMDNNFKGAVALYDFIIAYEGLGYTMEDHVHSIEPFRDEVAEDVAEAERLLSFLTYSFGLNLAPELKANYELEEARRREDELKEKTEQMDAIRRRLAREGQPIEAYILFLEKQVRALQNEADRLQSLYAEIELLESTERRLTEELDFVKSNLRDTEDKYRRAELAHEEAMRATVERYEGEIDALKAAHITEIAELTDGHTAEIRTLTEQHAAETDALTRGHETTIAEMVRRHESELEETKKSQEEAIASLTESVGTGQRALEEATAANEALLEEQRLLNARILGLRAGNRDISADERDAMTDEAAFDELERELESFVNFYKSQWSLTKRKIRKDLLDLKKIKGQSGKD